MEVTTEVIVAVADGMLLMMHVAVVMTCKNLWRKVYLLDPSSCGLFVFGRLDELVCFVLFCFFVFRCVAMFCIALLLLL